MAEGDPDFQSIDRATKLRIMAETLQDVFKGEGFALFVFDLDALPSQGNAGYVSNANRADIIKALKEFVQLLELDAHQGTKQ